MSSAAADVSPQPAPASSSTEPAYTDKEILKGVDRKYALVFLRELRLQDVLAALLIFEGGAMAVTTLEGLAELNLQVGPAVSNDSLFKAIHSSDDCSVVLYAKMNAAARMSEIVCLRSYDAVEVRAFAAMLPVCGKEINIKRSPDISAERMSLALQFTNLYIADVSTTQNFDSDSEEEGADE
jgi:hypothetical protein